MKTPTSSSDATGMGVMSRPPARASGDCGYFVAGTGMPVVMLHSSLGSRQQWSALAGQLIPKYQAMNAA